MANKRKSDSWGLPAKTEAWVDTLCLLTQPKEGQQQIKKTKIKNCQKIELYGSLTTKELKKKYSSRPVGGEEMGSRVERTLGKAGGPGQARQRLTDQVRQQLVDRAVPHLHADKQGGTTRERDRPCNPGF